MYFVKQVDVMNATTYDKTENKCVNWYRLIQ